MDFWKRTCNDQKSKNCKTKDQIQNYKINSLMIIKESDFDFLLLQETNPFFYFGKELNNKWPYEFDYFDKNIYYQNFRGLDWGNAIVANKKYKHLKNNISRGSYNDYYSKTGQMFFDFTDEYGNIITIINIYNKCKDKKWESYYETLENIILEIGCIVQSKNNLVILAGDFNGSVQSTDKFPNGDPKYIELFEKIKKLGFINCTENIGGTVSYNNYQNDYIFIKNYDNQNTKPNKHTEEKFMNYSDHYLIDYEIKL